MPTDYMVEVYDERCGEVVEDFFYDNLNTALKKKEKLERLHAKHGVYHISVEIYVRNTYTNEYELFDEREEY